MVVRLVASVYPAMRAVTIQPVITVRSDQGAEFNYHLAILATYAAVVFSRERIDSY